MIEKIDRCELLTKRISDKWNEEMITFYEQYNVNYASLEILNAMWEEPYFTLNSASKKLKKASPNISVIIRKMEEQELLIRWPSKSDKRIMYFKITDKGQEIAKEGKKYFNEILSKHITSEEKVDKLLSSLEVFYKMIIE